MSIEMPRGLPFSVDTFGPYTTTKKKKRHHFLTHAHKDHTIGISPSNTIIFPIYSTSLTISLLLQRHPQIDQSFFVKIEIGETLIVDDVDGEFKVTAFDANHCPGAVMYLFEGSFGNILHTGDCRLTLDCLPVRYVGGKGKANAVSITFSWIVHSGRHRNDDPFWKLLDIDMEVSATDTSIVTLSCCVMSEGLSLDSANSKMEPVIESSSIKKQLLSLSPEKNIPVRLSSQVSGQVHERKAIHTRCVYTKTSPEVEKLNLEKVVESLQDDTKEETVEKESCISFSSYSCSPKETCQDLGGDLRKLYRSMNAPVPHPLPSLVELMNSRKLSRK